MALSERLGRERCPSGALCDTKLQPRARGRYRAHRVDLINAIRIFFVVKEKKEDAGRENTVHLEGY